jgi:putative SOS response-associated peptidase YedK
VGQEVEIRPRYNVAPGDPVLAVTTDRAGSPRGELLRWGLVPPWADRPGAAGKMINARAETVADRPAFRQAFRQMRCLIPASGFYEWERQADGHKQAFHITAAGREVCAFAGLWALWRGPGRGVESPGSGRAAQTKIPGRAAQTEIPGRAAQTEIPGRAAQTEIRSCAILTSAANEAVAPLHDRMPVILPKAAEAAWLDTNTPLEELISLLTPFPAAETILRAVGPAVNDARYDGPECLVAASEASPQQPALF